MRFWWVEPNRWRRIGAEAGCTNDWNDSWQQPHDWPRALEAESGWLHGERAHVRWMKRLPSWLNPRWATHCSVTLCWTVAVSLSQFHFHIFRWPSQANDLVAVKVQNLSLLMSDTTLLCPIYSKYHGLSSFLLNPKSLIKYKASVCFWKSSSRELNILFGYQRYWNWPNLKLWHSARNAFVLTENWNWKILLCSTFPVFHFLTFGAPDKRPFVEVGADLRWKTCMKRMNWLDW